MRKLMEKTEMRAHAKHRRLFQKWIVRFAKSYRIQSVKEY